jgi:hypothetical protein
MYYENEPRFKQSLDQATCDWLPCATMVYLSCKFGEIDGWMQNTPNFVGTNNCSVIY